jgi:hypothetical protein
MVVTYHGGNILRGTSAERTGGTWTNLQAGYIYIESDTFAIYYWNGTTWNAVAAGGGGGSIFTSTTSGIVPASGGGSTNFLRADATWSTPAGGGDMTTNTAQTVSGAKTFLHQMFLLRNRANDASLTFQNPVFSGSKEAFFYNAPDFIVFVDVNDSNKVKAIDGNTRAKEFEHASDLGNVLNSIHGSLSSTSGGNIHVKSAVYSWLTQLAVTKAHVGLIAQKGATIIPPVGFATDMILVDKNDFLISDFYIDMSAMGNGTGTCIKIGSGAVNSDRPRVLRNYIRNPPTSGIHVASSVCNGLWAVDNSIQSFQSPTGNGIHLSNSADHKVYGNHVGGFGDATNGHGIMSSACANSEIMNNEIFTNRIGLRTYLPGSVLVIGNLIQNNTQHGIVISNDSATTFKKAIFALNRIHDNSTQTANTYDGINFQISGAGLIDDLVIIGNTIDPHTTNRQRYGISVNTNKLTNSVIALNAVGGNVTGGINLGTYDSSLRCFANAGDTVQPYLFEDFSQERVVAAPSDPASGFIRRYPKQINANNDGWFIKRKVNGIVVEVQVG